MKQRKKAVALLLVVVLCCAVASGCQGTAPSSSLSSQQETSQSQVTESGAQESAQDGQTAREEDIVFTYFVPDPLTKVPPQDAPVMEQVYEATGVRLEWILPPAEPEERLRVMLASDDLPDLIDFSNGALTDKTLMKQYKDAGKLLKLNELLEKNAPEILEVNWKDLKDKIADENGDFYYMPGGYRFEDSSIYPEAGTSFNVRTEYFEENGYEKIPKTFEEYKELLKQIQSENPDMVPVSLAMGPQGMLDSIIFTGAAANGLMFSDNLILEDGNLQYFVQNESMKEYFAFLNSLNVEGLLDIESSVLSMEMLKQKCVAGKVWSYIGSGWEINSEVIAYEAGNGSDAQMVYFYPFAEESVEKTSYAPYTVNLYNSGMTLTTACKDPDRYIRFYSYLNSEEGWLKQLGIVNYDFEGENTLEETEGYDYIVHKDIEYIPGRPFVEATTWMGEMWSADENWWWNHGINSLWAFTYGEVNHPNGQYDYVGKMDVGMWWDENTTRINGEMGLTGENYFDVHREMSVDVTEIGGLELDPQSQEYIDSLNLRTIYEKYLPRAVMAETPEAFEEEWKLMNEELEQSGLTSVVEAYQKLYEERMASWNN